MQGNIVKKEITPQRINNSAPSQDQYITAEEALSKALAHAGFAASEVTEIKTELDTDDGRYIYEVEFCKGNTEYEYKINSADGAVIEFEIDTDD